MDVTINGLQCIESQDLQEIKLDGNYFANVFSYVSINLNLCVGDKSCASQKEIEQFFDVNHPKVQYTFINTAIEYTKGQISHPVKHFADDNLFFPIDLGRQSQANLYIRKADLSHGKSWYQLGQSQYDYIKVE